MKIIKEEALLFFKKHPKVGFCGYDDIKYFINRLYKFGAKKVYVVKEYATKDDSIEDLEFVDTLYIIVNKTIPVDLAVCIAGSCRADEVSYVKHHKAIRLWWD